ncbi:MAG: MG2 domain-containing protein [Chitinophagaceae bacterium]
MMKIRYALLMSVVVLCAFIPGIGLDDRIIHALTTFNQQFPQEKVYLQLDKDYYANGETIWFKAYVTLQNIPTNLSTNLYVELLNKNGEILQRDLLPIQQGGSSGDFVLPRNFKAGDYRIRAYTAWMLNFDAAFLFQKDIQVLGTSDLNTGSTASADTSGSIQGVPSTHSQYAVQFFPEGGDMVNGLTSIVAFKAIDDQGLPLNVQGEVIDNTGTRIISIQSIHDGMGSFTITPQSGKTYSAVFKQDNGLKKIFTLPAALSSGIVLHVLQPPGKSKLYFSVSRSEKNKADYNFLKLVGQMNDRPVFITSIDFDQGLSGGMIPLNGLPSGIIQFTVMDTTGTPLAERLVFNNQQDHLNPRLVATQLKLSSRGKNIFQLEVPDSVVSDFSVAVTDADQVKTFPLEDNILSNLLLTSDLHGYVYHPAWYFQNQDPATLHDLDLVMMTNGWRRFSWKKILNHIFPTIKYPAENANLVIKGESLTMSNGKINMIIKVPADTMTFYITAPVNNLGEFQVTGLNFHDTAKVYYQGSKGKDNFISSGIHLFPSFSDNLVQVPITRPLHPAGISNRDELLHFLKITAERNRVNQMIHDREILLREVTIVGQRETPTQSLDKRYTSGLFSGGDAISFDLTKDQNIGYSDIFQFLQGRVAGLTVDGNTANPSISWRGGSPALYLNEIPVDAQTLSTTPVSEIALVKVFRPPFMGGFNGANGAIAIYTKKGGDNRSTSSGLTKGKKAGYTRVREFYSPDYQVKNARNELPDERTTIYWNPLLQPDPGNHTATFSFYNNDLTTRFHVVIEGMDENGRIGRLDTVLERP